MTHDDVLLAFVILAAVAFGAQALLMWRASNAIGEIRKEVREVRADLKQRIHAILTARVALDLTPAKKAILGLAGAAALAMPIVIGIMDADELEDYLELRNPKVKAQIRQSNLDIRAGRTRPAEDLLHDLKAATTKSRRRSRN